MSWTIRVPPSVVAQSGVDASALVKAPSLVAASNIQLSGGQADFKGSLLAQSGVDASAKVKGTIGDFAATVLAASLVHASGPVEGTIGSFLATVLAKSGLNASGAIEAPSFTAVSVINVSGAEAARSLIAASSLQVSGGQTELGGELSVKGSATVSGQVVLKSSLEVSGVVSMGQDLNVASNVLLKNNLTVRSALEVSAALSVGLGGRFGGAVSVNSSVIVQSALDASGQIKGGTSLLLSGDINASALAVRGLASIHGNATVSGTVGFKSTLEVSGRVSIVDLFVGNNLFVTSAFEVSAGVSAGGGGRFGGRVSVNDSVNAQSGLDASGLIKGGTSLLLSGDVNASALAVRGLASIHGNMTVSGVANSKSALNVSGTMCIAGAVLIRGSVLIVNSVTIDHIQVSTLNVGAGGIFNFGGGKVYMDARLSATISAVFQSGLNTSGAMALANSVVFAATASQMIPATDATISIGTGANRFATVRAVSVIQNDSVFSDPFCEVCGKPFGVGEQVGLLIAGIREDEGERIVSWVKTPFGDKPVTEHYKERLHGGRPAHLEHLIASMVKSAVKGS